MRREHFVNFTLWFAAFMGAVALTAVPGLLTDQTHAALWVALFVIGLALMAVLLVVAVVAALGDKEERRVLEKRNKMIPLVGMVICGVGLLAFASWYFWPSRQTSSPLASLVQPGPHARLVITGLTPYTAGDGPVGLRIMVANKGDAPTNPPSMVQVVLPSSAILSELQLREIVDKQAARVGGLFAQDRKDLVSVEPGEDGSLGQPVMVPRADWRAATEGKITLYVIVLFAYTDGHLRDGAMWVHSYCAAFRGPDGYEVCENRTFVQAAGLPASPASTRAGSSWGSSATPSTSTPPAGVSPRR